MATGPLLGQGHIALTVSYKGAFDQVRRELGLIEQESQKTSQAVQSHVERTVKATTGGSAEAWNELKKRQQEYAKATAELEAAEKRRDERVNAGYSKQIGTSKELRDSINDVTEATKRQTDAMEAMVRAHSKALKDSGRGLRNVYGDSLKEAQGKFADWGTNNTTMAKVIGQGMGHAIATPIKLAITGIKGVFVTVLDFMQTAVKGAALAIGGIISAGVAGAIYKGIERLDTVQMIKLKLKYDDISGADADQIVDDMRDLSRRIALPLAEALNTAETFAAAGVKPGEDLNRIMELSADVAAKSGQSINSVGDTMLRFMQGNTERSAMMLQTWEQNGISIVSGLAKKLGMSTSEVYKALSDGAIAWADVQRVLEEQVSGFAEDASNTLGAQVTRIWESLADVGEAALAPFFGTAVTGLGGIADKLQEVAEWLGNNQAEIVGFVGKMVEGFFDAGKSVTLWVATTLDGIAAVVHAIGTMIDVMPGDGREQAQSVWDASDGIRKAADALRETEPMWDRGAVKAQNYFEALQSVVNVQEKGARATLGKDGRLTLAGTDDAIKDTKKDLNSKGIPWRATDSGGIEIVPATDEAKRVIDNFRIQQGQEPIYMDVYVQYHRLGADDAPDGTKRVPGEASRTGDTTVLRKPLAGPVNQNRSWVDRAILGVPVIGTLWDWIDNAPPAPIKNPDGSFTDQTTGENYFVTGSGPGIPADQAGKIPVKGTPGQGLPLPWNLPKLDGGKDGVEVPLEVNPEPAVNTFGEFAKGVFEAVTPTQVSANVEAGLAMVGEFVKGIKDADPAPAPLTADLDDAEKQYDSFVDKVKNTMLSIPMGMGMMGGFGGFGGGGGNVSTAGLQPQSLAALQVIQGQFPGVPLTSGFRASDPYPWHPGGRGLDLGVNANTPEGSALGDTMKAWLELNKEVLGINHVLWKVKDHFDHIHVGLNEGPSPLLMGMGMGGSGMDISNSFGGGGLPGGGLMGGRLSAGRNVGGFPLAPADDDDGKKPLPDDWKPVGIPGQDPYATKPQKEKKKKDKDLAVPGVNYLPDDAGYFDYTTQDFMTSPEITPEEAMQLRNLVHRIGELKANLEIAKQELEEAKNNSDTTVDQMRTRQKAVADLERDIKTAEEDFGIKQNKFETPGKGKRGKGKGFWDQTLGEFVQSMQPDMGDMGDMLMGGVRESFMPEGFSDPSGWGLMQAGQGVLGFLSGIVQDPYAAGALGIASGAMGGSGSNMMQAVMGMLPYPFGTLDMSPEAEVAPAMPGLDQSGAQRHRPPGTLPGTPLQPGPSGNVTNDNRIQVSGDRGALVDETVSKATNLQAPTIRNALKPLGAAR